MSAGRATSVQPSSEAWPEAPLVFGCEGEDLVGILHAGQPPRSRVGVVIVVGGPQYRVGSHRQFVSMARALAAEGYPVLRFDYRGMGDSAGASRTFEDVDADIRSAIDALLRTAPGVETVVLFGLCDAASAALMYAYRDARVGGMLLANPWVRTDAGEARTYLRHYYLRRVLQLSFWRKVFSGAFNAGKSLSDFKGALQTARGESTPSAATAFLERMLEGWRGFDRPVCFLLSGRDLTAREFSDRCREQRAWRAALQRNNVEVVSLPEADHTFSTRAALRAAVESSLAWLDVLARRGAP